MNNPLTKIGRIKNNLEKIREVLDADIIDTDIQMVQNKGLKISQLIGSSAECKSKAKGCLEIARLKALSLIQKEPLGWSIMSKKMDAMCADEVELLEYADRINSSCVHSLDYLRSVISLYKTEYEYEHRSI